jgi:uncharacterized membrane protein (UPF0127 family)
MPVLIDGATWIARRRTLEERLPGGSEALTAMVSDDRLCADGDLVAISFATAAESRKSARVLEQRGLRVVREDGAFEDAAVVHHRIETRTWCPWLELASVPLPSGGRVLAARVSGAAGTEVAVPRGWSFEHSASAREGVIALRPADRPLRFLRREPSAAVYLDGFAGEEVRVPLPAPVRVVVETAAGARHEVAADVVQDGRAIELGLMHRDRLDPGAGMLFRFGWDDWRSFWMKNTRIGLDMLFVRSDGVVANVAERAQPMTLWPNPSREPCATVLEVACGWAKSRGVRAGDRVEVVPG